MQREREERAGEGVGGKSGCEVWSYDRAQILHLVIIANRFSKSPTKSKTTSTHQ
jgi:hypothetical protein